MNAPTIITLTQPADLIILRKWSGPFHGLPEKLPISFRCDGQLVRGIPAVWRPTVTTRRLDAHIIETVYEGTDPFTELTMRVEFLEYLDFPVVEWTVWFINTGDAASPLLSEIQGLDAVFPANTPLLQHNNGDFYSEEGYTPSETTLPPGAELTLAPDGGPPLRRRISLFPPAR